MKRSDPSFQIRQVLEDNGPDDVQVYAEVFMHDSVSEPDDLAPFDFRVRRL